MSLIPAVPATRSRPDATRQRVLDAAVSCVSRHGFQRTNLASIARESGMTTGAIQHHFGDKASLLAAVVERGFASMVERLSCLPLRPSGDGSASDLTERVRNMVDALWAGYEAKQTRASLEILFAMRGDAAFGERANPFLVGMSERVDRLWMGSFWDLDLPRVRHMAAQRLIFTTLNGLALERILMPAMPDPRSDLDRLVRGVIHIFEEETE
jgi:AcrR family transcriptional regulator